MLYSDDPLHAGAYMHLDDPDYKEWAEKVSEAEPILWSGGKMDAPWEVPAGSMKARDMSGMLAPPQPYQTTASRDDDWAWTDCPVSGARIRVPYGALKYLRGFRMFSENVMAMMRRATNLTT